MKGFDLHEPTTVTQAVGLLDQLGVVVNGLSRAAGLACLLGNVAVTAEQDGSGIADAREQG